MLKHLWIYIIALCSVLELSATDYDIISDSCLSVLEESHFKRLDSLASVMHYTLDGDESFLPTISSSDVELEALSDSAYAHQLNLIPTTIPLTYNGVVRRCIEYFTIRNKTHTGKMRGYSQIYFPLFEQILDQKQLPLELKYLAVIESAFNPRVVSRMGATGLWQLMYGTGKYLGLTINTFVDERRDPLKSTMAATDYLQYLYGMYDDWLLAIAAYNSGPGNVNKAIRRAGGIKDFWAIKSFLPRETQSYVPLFIGVTYAMHYAENNNIPKILPEVIPPQLDTVYLRNEVSLSVLDEELLLPAGSLALLNPSLKLEKVPNSLLGTPIYIPASLATKFILVEEKLNSDSLLQAKMVMEAAKEVERTRKLEASASYYTVRSGDNLGFIAQKYGVGVSSLKAWNGLRNSRIRIGQKLKIYNSGRAPKSSTTQSSKPSSSTGSSTATHIVQTNQTLGEIASKYGCSVSDLQAWNSLSSSKIYKGQKLAVKEPSSTSEYTIKNGDSLWEISKTFGMSLDELCKLNGISSKTTIKPGNKLTVSKG